MKKYTSKAIYNAIEANSKESRREWLLLVLKYNNRIWLWEEGYHGEETMNIEFYDTKVNYIRMNPVRAGVVEKRKIIC
ncbi:hypothetical protein LVD17_11905 [Fulvivirga ulvae]|uniref:hypothetical protein n=1 Tax=Fulvivirga ulvae TaxID=2904245 RepID=UPI001F18E0E5|nr:hypothetical protein [Fulvivirga ulvae]UII34513.1 hypothetical protein LVD17_11905 [Fulvivirga ulvae]